MRSTDGVRHELCHTLLNELYASWVRAPTHTHFHHAFYYYDTEGGVKAKHRNLLSESHTQVGARFQAKFALEDPIGSRACSLEARACV